MNITPRLKQIFQILLQEQAPISVKDLSERAGISKRTVQRELEHVLPALADSHLVLMSKTGVGIWLDGTQIHKDEFEAILAMEEEYDASNREERRKRLILETLREKGLKKLYHYSCQFGVSEATISSDLEAVKEWMNQQGLQIIKRPGSGILIEGSEEIYRKAIGTFLNENADMHSLIDAYQEGAEYKNAYGSLRAGTLGQLLDEDIMRRVKDCIDRINHTKFLDLTENSYTSLIIHISIAINRMK